MKQNLRVVWLTLLIILSFTAQSANYKDLVTSYSYPGPNAFSYNDIHNTGNYSDNFPTSETGQDAGFQSVSQTYNSNDTVYINLSKAIYGLSDLKVYIIHKTGSILSYSKVPAQIEILGIDVDNTKHLLGVWDNQINKNFCNDSGSVLRTWYNVAIEDPGQAIKTLELHLVGKNCSSKPTPGINASFFSELNLSYASSGSIPDQNVSGNYSTNNNSLPIVTFTDEGTNLNIDPFSGEAHYHYQVLATDPEGDIIYYRTNSPTSYYENQYITSAKTKITFDLEDPNYIDSTGNSLSDWINCHIFPFLGYCTENSGYTGQFNLEDLLYLEFMVDQANHPGVDNCSISLNPKKTSEQNKNISYISTQGHGYSLKVNSTKCPLDIEIYPDQNYSLAWEDSILEFSIRPFNNSHFWVSLYDSNSVQTIQGMQFDYINGTLYTVGYSTGITDDWSRVQIVSHVSENYATIYIYDGNYTLYLAYNETLYGGKPYKFNIAPGIGSAGYYLDDFYFGPGIVDEGWSTSYETPIVYESPGTYNFELYVTDYVNKNLGNYVVIKKSIVVGVGFLNQNSSFDNNTLPGNFAQNCSSFDPLCMGKQVIGDSANYYYDQLGFTEKAKNAMLWLFLIMFIGLVLIKYIQDGVIGISMPLAISSGTFVLICALIGWYDTIITYVILCALGLMMPFASSLIPGGKN